MATKTDESVTGQKYTRQRSNSDPQPNLDEQKETLSVKGNNKQISIKSAIKQRENVPTPVDIINFKIPVQNLVTSFVNFHNN